MAGVDECRGLGECACGSCDGYDLAMSAPSESTVSEELFTLPKDAADIYEEARTLRIRSADNRSVELALDERLERIEEMLRRIAVALENLPH